MKKVQLLILFLLAFLLNAAEQSTPYVLTEFPIAILPADTAVWIKWTGTLITDPTHEEFGSVDSGTIYYSREPGGSKIENYEGSITTYFVEESGDTSYNDTISGDKSVPERGTKFTPSENMETGIYYLMVGHVTAAGDTLYSNEIKFIVKNPNTPRLISPVGDGITDVTPTFNWEGVSDVPYYHIIVTDEPINLGEDNSLSGLSIIWQAITSGSQITYGAPDPSGTITATPPPLSPGTEYSWLVLNNYGNNAAFTAVDVVLPNVFSLVGDTLKTPELLTPIDGDTLKSENYETEPLTLTWTNLDSSANTYKVYLYAASEMEGLEAQIAIWDGEVTAGEFAGSDVGYIKLDAKNILTTNNYSWKVIAVDAKGYGQASKLQKFRYEASAGGVLVRTKESIKAGDSVIVQNVALCEIKVEVLDGSMENPLLFYTDQNGYLYRSRPTGTYRFTAVKDGYTSVTKTATIVENDTTEITLYLERPDASVYGNVKDATGTPVNLAKIYAVSTLGDSVYTETDPSGNFVVNCGKGDWDITAKKDGYSSPLPTRVTVDFGESKPLDESIVLTRNSYVISGTVVNDNSEPIVAAKVTLKDENNTTVAENPSTSSNGQYSFSVNPGTYTLVVTKTGFTSFSESVSITSSIQKNITLSAGAAQITGSIFGKSWSFDGTPTVAAIRGMDIVAYDQSGSEVASATTDTWGSFTLGVPGGGVQYMLKYSATGYEPDSGQSDTISSGVTYTYRDTLIGFASLKGMVRQSGTTDPVGDIQISLVDSTGEVAVTGQSDNEGSVEFYNLNEGTYTLIAAGTGKYADTISMELFSGSTVISNQITAKNGRIYNADSLVKEFDITLEDGTGSIFWISNTPDSSSADVKVITPLLTKVPAGDTLSNIGLGTYRIEVDALSDTVIDCSKHLTEVTENNVTVVDTITLGFTHSPEDSTDMVGDLVTLLVNAKDLTSSVAAADVYYRSLNSTSFTKAASSTVANGVISFQITPPKDGTYLEYYFHIVMNDGDEFGYSKELYRSFIKPDPSVISRLELVPVADTSGYTLPLSGKLQFELRGYYGDNYNALDTIASQYCSWTVTGPSSVDASTEFASAVVTGNSAGSGTITVTFKQDDKLKLAAGVDSVITRSLTVSETALKTLSVARVSSHPDEGFISNLETAEFTINALDGKGSKVFVTPDWLVYPKSAGTISSSGIFTPEKSFTGRVIIVAAVNDTIRAEWKEHSEAPVGMLIGTSVQDSDDSVEYHDGFELTLNVPENSVTSPVKLTVDHPQFKNAVYKSVPDEGISLVSRLYLLKRESSNRFRSDSVLVGVDSVARSSRVTASIKVPDEYTQYLDATGGKFTIAMWDDKNLRWESKWAAVDEDEEITRAKDNSIPEIVKNVSYNPETKSFNISVGDTLNSESGKLMLAVLFDEAKDVQGAIHISPNPFSPYVAPMRDFLALPGMNADVKGTCLKITPMSSTSGNNPKVSINIYTANRTLVWEYIMPKVIPGKDYYVFWDGRTRRGRGELGEHISVAENTPIRPVGNEMCRNGRYFAVVTIDDGKTQKRFTKEIILFK